jgi:hypothetical protein
MQDSTRNEQKKTFKIKAKPIGTVSVAPMMDWTDRLENPLFIS